MAKFESREARDEILNPKQIQMTKNVVPNSKGFPCLGGCGPSDFDFVSHFDIRISNLILRWWWCNFHRDEECPTMKNGP